MKSVYKRQFAILASMILFSFFVLGASFSTLSYQYTVREMRSQLERNAKRIATLTEVVVNQNLFASGSFLQNYISSIAEISGAHVTVCDANGAVIYLADGTRGENPATAAFSLPASVVRQVAAGESYSGISTGGGVRGQSRYIAGTPVFRYSADGGGTVFALVFLSSDATDITEMWREFFTIFLFTSVLVCLLAFGAASITTFRQAKPLQEMATAARRFGHGEFDVRVDTYGRQDEVGRLAEAFNAMADSLCKAEERRREFVANVSHELKTPMTTIAGFADGILDGTVPPEREQEAVQLISDETRRLSRLVRRMLDLSRLQSTDSVIGQEKLDIEELMTRVLVSLENKINARKLDVVIDFPEGPLSVWGDGDAITQVGYNLLDNAIKFSHEAGHLTVSIKRRGGKAYISVRNEGETIPPEDIPLIFDRFHKTDRSRSADREGLGLGLYIVKTILNTHKESITVTSEEGVTEFTFTLTLAE